MKGGEEIWLFVEGVSFADFAVAVLCVGVLVLVALLAVGSE